MLDSWKENLVLRIAVVGITWLVIAGVALFFWDWSSMIGGLGSLGKWATVIGSGIAAIALIVNPLLEDYA
jgi:hypothetical protein